MRTAIRARFPLAAAGWVALALVLPGQDGAESEPDPAPFLYYWSEEMPEGQVVHSRAFLVELKSRIEEVNPEVSISVFAEPLATAGVMMHWFGASPSAAGFERTFRANSRDPEVQRILGGTGGLFVPATHRSTLLSPCPARELAPGAAERVHMLVTTARVKPADYPETRARAVELTSYVNERYPEVSARLYSQMIGEVPALVWLYRVESLAVWDEVSRRVLEDGAYVELYRQTFRGVLDDGVHMSWLVPFL